jgi:hypothetical protein
LADAGDLEELVDGGEGVRVQPKGADFAGPPELGLCAPTTTAYVLPGGTVAAGAGPVAADGRPDDHRTREDTALEPTPSMSMKPQG